MKHFIENLRNKPEHVRRRVALGTAGCVTALVVIGWGTAFVSSGTLALSPSGVAPALASSGTEFQSAMAQGPSGFSQLAGSAATAFSGASTTPPTLTSEDVKTTSTVDQSSTESGRTVIPF